jgi:serine/threonine protein kinase/tetratricopeptide (TPR) repeat protein
VSFPSDTAATWSALQRLLETALALPDADRLIWLERSAEVPDALREPLRRLLEVQAGIDTRAFVATLPQAGVGVIPATPVLIGDMVGPYRLLQELGDGGMGSVWLAERADGALKRKVALKLPRLAWASDLAGRMARERDILGSLEHPNIARLYDAGVDQHGRPFLALEYVEGQRLDRYCDEQGLTVQERIRLFLQVLDAVQYAHVNLVLHRDLKPANVLVNQRGEIRLLDFGIAKLMAEDSGSAAGEPRSESLSRAMTPRFASPEQVQHSRLTLASDIYSLGVVLYEILIGASPLITTHGSRAEFEIAIVDARLRTPSRAKVEAELALKRRSSPGRLSRILRGDLDAVILKAMARKPEDRYVSAEAMRADLVRWLDGRPVEATPPSRLVALRKFIARNSLAVGFGTAAVTAIVAIAAIAVLQAREARLESQRATATRDFVLSLFENANPELHGGRDVTVRELMERVDSQLLARRTKDPKTFTDLYSAAATLWARLGDKEKAGLLLAKRAEFAEAGGSESMIINALLDQAEFSIQMNDVVSLEKVVARLSRIYGQSDFSGKVRSDYLYFKGWQALKSGEFGAANKLFNQSLSYSKSRGFEQEALRAYYGKIRVQITQGNRTDALRDLKTAQEYISNSRLDRIARMSSELELVSMLYALGEYRIGLPIINKIFEESENVMGSFNRSQRDIYIYWLNWGLHSGGINEGISWFNKAREASSGDTDRMVDLDTRFKLTEIEYHLANGDAKTTAIMIEKMQGDNPYFTDSDRRSISLTRMQLSLLLKRPNSILIELNRPEWSEERWSAADSVWAVYKLWYQGMASFQLGDFVAASSAYERAESLARVRFGEAHPRRLLIALNKIFVDVINEGRRGDASFREDDELRKELYSLLQSLRLVLPESSPVLKKVNECFEINNIESKTSGRRSDWSKESLCLFN